MFTHEQFVTAVYSAVLAGSLSSEDRTALESIKLVYGAGQTGLRGVTYYNRWGKGEGAAVPFVEVCAFGQESIPQLAGTVIHELGHVTAGWNAAHGKEWKAACKRLGLSCVKAAGTQYKWSMFDARLRHAIHALPKPDDGAPVNAIAGLLPKTGNRMLMPKPCGAGIGTKGGKSRGVGSGSRLRLFECECVPPVKVRASRDVLAAHCDCCTASFHIV